MLKNRIFTALVLIPLIILAIFLLPPLSFLSVAMLITLLAGWEWAQIAGLEQPIKKTLYLLGLAAGLLLAISIPIFYIVVVGFIWWLVAAILLGIYPRGIKFWGHPVMRGIMGYLVLIPFWIGLILLQGFSPILLLFSLVLIWAVDSAAYFVGKKWGFHKLAPLISPGKSYEGFWAGLIMALCLSIIGVLLLHMPYGRWLTFISICFIGAGMISVLGDLFESMMKRLANVKDSGSLLPGHGGILDRIDSLTTAIPFFALIFSYFFNS